MALEVVPDEYDEAAPEAPAELGVSGRRLWDAALSDQEFDVHEELLLMEACRTADLLDRLAAEAAAGELTVTNQKGDRIANPVVVEARQQKLVLARLLASLRLPSGEAGERPQRRGAARGSYGVRRAV
jgi:hypothetical protein